MTFQASNTNQLDDYLPPLSVFQIYLTDEQKKQIAGLEEQVAAIPPTVSKLKGSVATLVAVAEADHVCLYG